MSFAEQYLAEVVRIAAGLDAQQIETMARDLVAVRAGGGRLFFLGVGGGAGHAGHAVNDFRKIAGFEAYAPTDNVSELTARTNDEGWDTTFAAWLRTSRLGERDALLVFSVGGGSREMSISMNLVQALELARATGVSIHAVVGKPDGSAARLADHCIVVKAPPERLTPHVEAFQCVLWHGLVSHPALAVAGGKWESVSR